MKDKIVSIGIGASLWSTLFQINAMANNIINQNTVNKINEFRGEINAIVNVVLAFSVATSILIFIIHFLRLAGTPNHPLMRAMILRDIATTAAIVAVLGSIGVVAKILIGVFM